MLQGQAVAHIGNYLTMDTWQYAQLRTSAGITWWTAPGEDWRLDGADTISHLNEAGKHGWELVAMAEAASGGWLTGKERVTKYVLKRSVGPDSD
jgi:hypothetical protein